MVNKIKALYQIEVTNFLWTESFLKSVFRLTLKALARAVPAMRIAAMDRLINRTRTDYRMPLVHGHCAMTNEQRLCLPKYSTTCNWFCKLRCKHNLYNLGVHQSRQCLQVLLGKIAECWFTSNSGVQP